MNLTVEQIAEEALSLPSEARAFLADRLAESLDPAEDGYVHQLWIAEARRRRDDVRSGRVQTIPGDEAMAQVRQAFARWNWQNSNRNILSRAGALCHA